ncbi:MAG: glycerophosphodiester phosphodiesterase family protein [Oscillospiraceae bacterium]
MNWKTACKIAAPAAACAGAFAFLVAPGRATRAQKAPFLCRNYAHRGLHTEDGSVPENSLPAFRAAAEAGYAVEMDVHLTADDQLVVFTTTRSSACAACRASLMISPSPSCARCVSERPSASSRRLPRRSRRSGGRVPLLLEVKRGHDNRRLCALTLEALRTYAGPYCVESFDPTIVAWFRRNAPDILRGQLSQPPKAHTARR